MTAASVFAAFEPVGDYVSHEVSGNTILITCKQSHKVRLMVCRPDIIRVEYDPDGAFVLNPYTLDDITNDRYSYAHNKAEFAPHLINIDWPSVSFSHEDAGDYLKITTSELTVRVYKSPLRVHFYDASNSRLINSDDDSEGMKCATGSQDSQCELYMRKKMLPDEHFFGFGNSNKGFSDPHKCDYRGYTEGPNPDKYMYRGSELYGAPFFYSTRGYGILMANDATLDNGPNTGTSLWDMGKTSPDYYSIHFTFIPANKGETPPNAYEQYLIYFFIYGQSWEEVVNHYTDITGKPHVLRKKHFGVHAVERVE